MCFGPLRLYSSNGHTSTLNYTPTTDMEYGTLACYGENAVGQQKVPCLFQLVAAGKLISYKKHSKYRHF